MKSDKELIRLLESDPNEGMVQIMEQHLKLVHSIASKLKKPEDVKDCINDTFTDFYRYRSSFDPNKGSLGNYLAAITRKNAADIAARNQKHAAEAYPDDIGIDPVSGWDRQIDMERAIRQLSDMDAELIRMKYYQGKSLHQIADSLGISYENTKKRHQRSLVALKKALITMLILALLAALAACAVAVLRYFGIVPGYGIQVDPTETQYVLTAGETVQSDHFQITVEDAWLHGDALDVLLCFEWSDPDTDISVLHREEYLEWYMQMQLGEGIGGELRVQSNISNWETGSFTTAYTLLEPQLIGEQGALSCVLLFDGAQIRFRVSQTEPQELGQAGYSVLTEEGGFHALPRIEDGHLYVQIYPLDPENYTIDRNLSAYYLKYQFGLSGDVTATAEDGTVLVGSVNRNTEQVSEAFCEWDFGEAEPGAYKLHIPFVFMQRNMDESIMSWNEISFTGGGPVTVPMPEGTITMDTVQALGQNEEGQYRWWLPVKTDISGAYQLLSMNFFFLPENAVNLPESTAFSSEEIRSGDAITGYECRCTAELTGVRAQLQKISFLWECDTTIPIWAE